MIRWTALLLLVFVRVQALAAQPIRHAAAAPTAKAGEEADGADGNDAIDANDEDEDEDEDDDDTPDPKRIEANVAMLTDYILRGLTQTEHNPAIQGGFDWEHPLGVFLGVWASNVHFDGAPEIIEAAFSAGYYHQITQDLGVSIAASYLSYFPSGDINSWDFPLRVEWKGWSAELDYSLGWQGEGDSWYVQAGWSDEVVYGFTLGAFAGYSFFPQQDEQANYADFRVTASHECLELQCAVSGIFVSQREINDTEVGPRAVVSVSKSF